MKVIEVSINVNSLVDKINQLEQLVKEINRFDFKGTFKKEGEINEYSTNIGDISELLNRLKKLIKEINNFNIKATTRKKKPT